MEFRLKDFYVEYLKKGGTLDKKIYKLIVQTFLKNVFEMMLEGKSLHLGYHLGWFRIAKYERDYKRPTINWGESNKYKKTLLDEGKPLYDKETGEGHQWLIYFTDKYYYGFFWKKERIKDIGSRVTLHNVHFYQLHPFKRAHLKLSENINELSPIIYEPIEKWNLT